MFCVSPVHVCIFLLLIHVCLYTLRKKGIKLDHSLSLGWYPQMYTFGTCPYFKYSLTVYRTYTISTFPGDRCRYTRKGTVSSPYFWECSHFTSPALRHSLNVSLWVSQPSLSHVACPHMVYFWIIQRKFRTFCLITSLITHWSKCSNVSCVSESECVLNH